MKKKQSLSFPLRLLSWIPSLLSLIIILAITIPMVRFVMPTGSVLCRVEGDSMNTTLHDGQFMFQGGKDFSRGDIVICNLLNADGTKKILIKRIIGMPGDSVRIDPTGVYINEEKITEDYLTANAVAGTYRESHKYQSIHLAQDAYFVMGDNREVSYDSRFFGGVHSSDMIYVMTTKPTLPFFLALIPVVVMIAIICWLETLLDELFLRLFCRMSPALKAYVEEEKKKKAQAKE